MRLSCGGFLAKIINIVMIIDKHIVIKLITQKTVVSLSLYWAYCVSFRVYAGQSDCLNLVTCRCTFSNSNHYYFPVSVYKSGIMMRINVGPFVHVSAECFSDDWMNSPLQIMPQILNWVKFKTVPRLFQSFYSWFKCMFWAIVSLVALHILPKPWGYGLLFWKRSWYCF